MTDSPAFRSPLDPKEQPILDTLLTIRDKLSLMKSDKSQYVKSQDVVACYNQTIDQVEALNQLRETKRNEQNRVDTVLDDCFQLISLFFMTIGRNAEAPAAYSLVSTSKRLIEHLAEAGFFATQDLEGLSHRLDIIKETVTKSRSTHSPHLLTLLDARIGACQTILDQLKAFLSRLSPEYAGVHTKLVSILRSLSGLNTKAKFDAKAVKDFQTQLREIEAHLDVTAINRAPEVSASEAIERYADKLKGFTYTSDTPIPGHVIVQDLLERCFLWSEIVLERQGKIDDKFRDTFEQLNGIRNQLEKLSLTQAWSLRETDLYSYQRKLDRIDESRINADFVDAQGKPADIYEQRTLLYLLRKSYANIYHMMTSSEPVSEALLPIYNQLMTLKRCLVEVKRSGGVSSPRELYPYSMKLNSIDNMRQDGKFVVNGDVPEGQGSVSNLLAECFDLAYDLRNEADGADEDDSRDASDKDDEEDSGPSMADSALKGMQGMSIGVK